MLEKPTTIDIQIPGLPAARPLVRRDILAGLVIGVAAMATVMLLPSPARKRPLSDDPMAAFCATDAAAAAWTDIVIHHSATTGGSAAAFSRNHTARLGTALAYHFVIGNGSGAGDGEIEIGPGWRAQKGCPHAGDARLNRSGIAICLVGNFETDPGGPTEKQMASLVALVGYLAGEFGIDSERVFGHNAARNTKCPGRFFPLDGLRERLSERVASRRYTAEAGDPDDRR